MKFNYISLSFLIGSVICGLLGSTTNIKEKPLKLIGCICLFGGIIIWIITGKL